MNHSANRAFIHENFLLESSLASRLYHDYAKDLPIIDYHNHLSAQDIAENKPLQNITRAWLGGDHYKWRAMRANGIPEEFITGKASDREKFEKWAQTVPHAVRNPLFHWTQLELKRYFNIDQILSEESAGEIYEKTNGILTKKTPAQLLEQMKVEILCTTNDPLDDLSSHVKIAQGNFGFTVLPTFRSDDLFMVEPTEFLAFLRKLEGVVSFKIESLDDLAHAIDSRIEFFHQQGCRLSDFGMGGSLSFVQFNLNEVEGIFSKFLRNEKLDNLEINKYRSFMFLYLGKKYHEKSWVQQYHLGAIRNNNSRLGQTLGSDAGCDSIGDYAMSEFMASLFDELDRGNQLSKTIAYNLNPAQNEVFATMMGNYNDGSFPGKMQWGAAWWFLDQKDGIEKHLNVVSNMGLLSRFIGMITDSRSFLSFPRHEYFRRILCNVLARDLKKGLIPDDQGLLRELVKNVCYANASRYFEFERTR